jgi:hypothetical protein
MSKVIIHVSVLAVVVSIPSLNSAISTLNLTITIFNSAIASGYVLLLPVHTIITDLAIDIAAGIQKSLHQVIYGIASGISIVTHLPMQGVQRSSCGSS